MISELHEIKCIKCGKQGYDDRKKVEKVYVVTTDDELREGIIWTVKCRHCKITHKLIWQVG